MTTHEELAALKQRLGAAEYELGQLRLKLNGVEARLTESQPIATPVAEPVTTPAPSVAVQRSQAAVVEPMSVPPLLPPVLRPPPAPAAAPETEVESAWSRLRAALQQFQLWPPSGESNAEVRLGAWWATRIGALLAVIGVVFFGIYVSLATPPWLNWRSCWRWSVASGRSGYGWSAACRSWGGRVWRRTGVVVFQCLCRLCGAGDAGA